MLIYNFVFFFFRLLLKQKYVAYSNSDENNHHNNNICYNSEHGLFENMAGHLKTFPIGKKSVKIENRSLTSQLQCISDDSNNTIQIFNKNLHNNINNIVRTAPFYGCVRLFH